MAGSAHDGDSEISGINVTPLVDILLVLVIILFVTAEFTRYRTVPVSLPKVNAAAMKREPHRVSLTVRPGGEVFWNDQKVSGADMLSARLKSAQKTHPDVAVILRAEGNTEYAALLSVLDEVKTAGISRVGLAVEKKSKAR